MIITRVRIKHPNGRISVIDQAWSQLCATIADDPDRKVRRERLNAFWRGEEVLAADGGTMKYVGPGNL